MNILIIAEGMDIGGAETHVNTLCRALVRGGNEITLLSAGGRYADELKSEGIRCVTAPTGGRDVRSLHIALRVIRKECREHRYDVVHAHTRGCAVMVRWATSLPLAFTIHLDFPVGPVRRALAELGDATLAVSEDLTEYLTREYRLGKDRIRITRNAIDPERFPFYGALAQSIVHVSRLDSDRSLVAGLLCTLAPTLLREHPDVKIYISGDGNDAARIRRLAREANALLGREGVVLLGARTDIPEVLRLGRIFVGVSRAALEAMSCGAAVVLAGNDGYGSLMYGDALKKAAQTNFCARGEARCTEGALLLDLRTLLSDEALCQRMGREGREMILREYCPARMAEDAQLSYLDAIQRRRRRVALVGYYGYGNLGDEASRESLARVLSDYEVTPLVRKKTVDGEKSRYFSAFSTIRKCGTVVFGGGNLFQDTSSSRSLRYYLTLLAYAKARGCKTVLLGGGIGDLRSIGEEKMRRALPLFDHLACRTHSDISYLGALGRDEDVSYLPDPVFVLSAPSAKKERLAVCFLNGTREPKGRELVFYNLRTLGYRLVFVPLFKREDEGVCRRFARESRGELALVKCAEELFSLLSRAGLCVSERLHGGVFSLLCHTPSFLLCEDGKSLGLSKDVAAYCEKIGVRCPILPFTRYTQIQANVPTLRTKKETEGEDPFGFSNILEHFRSYWEAGVRL